jgi:predicted Zn-dependent protease
MTQEPPGENPRRRKIEAMLAEDPDDVFLRYSLALAMEADGEWEAALEILESLGRAEPAYVPALQMSGQMLVAHGQVEAARRALREGIEQARSQGQSHAAAEMAELLTTLGAAGE